jgi:pimeloyl-ACP methyl ester carboxylesterase
MSLSESHEMTAADGIRLHVRIRGKNSGRPPLLYLHGGPGGALNLAAFETCAGPFLENTFPVAYLHQRGVLRSKGHDGKEQRLRLHIQDIREVVAFLCHRFQQRRVHLLGHSWGGFVALAYLARYASTVARVVAICPLVSFPDAQRDLYEMVSRRVLATGDGSERQELASIGMPPYPDIDDFIRLQGLGAELYGDPYRYLVPDRLSDYTGYRLEPFHCLGVQTRIAAALWPQLYRADLTRCIRHLSTPLMMMACSLDTAVPWTSVERAFTAYAERSPNTEKRWLLLEGSNHLPFTEPAARERCLEPIVGFLKAAP